VTDPAAIIDDGDAGFSATSNFFPATDQGFQGDLAFANPDPGVGGEEATWTFTTLPPGVNRISATWHPDPNRATNAPFTIFDGSNNLGTFTINQELDPDDFVQNGVGWEDLGGGVFSITSGTLVVRLTNNADEYVIADAIRIEALSLSGGGGAGGAALMGGAGESFVALPEARVRVTSVRHANRGPFARFTVIGPARVNTPVTFVFNNPAASGYRYSFDFNNDGDFTDPGEIVNGTSPLRTSTFTRRGWNVVHGRIADALGHYNDFWTRVFVDL
jgi:hypothetical protein